MTASETSVPPRRLDPHFRWRGSSVTRLEAFTDAVFAIVLALLFLRAAPPETFTDLKAAMKGLVPFAATFAIVAYVWLEHWLYSRRYGLEDGPTVFLHLLLLFLILFYAYPLKFLFTLMTTAWFGPIGTLTRARMLEGFGDAFDAKLLFAFYGVGYGAIFGVLALLYHRALRLADHLQLSPAERLLTRSGRTQCLIQVAFAAASMLLAAAGVGLGFGVPGFVYAAIGPVMALHARTVARRMGRLLAGS